MSRFKVIKCRISRGGFSGERVFKLTLENREYEGIASRAWFWSKEGRPLDPNEPSAEQEVDGKLAVRLIRKENGVAVVSIPDDEVLRVPVTDLSEPSAEMEDVLVGS